ncbi:hypothetical protein KGF57_005140 [Candida theae]|uniref:Uncharacterized protein n=1 Tax=Candida theae TaxID=1198502 RepID=A0AAD5B9W5_9ASCO|nr:uncharacterized protein KGF57_005140 [Candida theae]KAI5948947.1 hypothetical protein KGF57_005140 [Candida theae]
MSTQFQPKQTNTPLSSFDGTVPVSKPNSKQHHPNQPQQKQQQQQQQDKTYALPTSPSSLDHSESHKTPMFTFDGYELSKGEQAEAEDEDGETKDDLNPYQYGIEPPAIFERSVQDCCSPHRTNSIISLTNTLNNYTPSSSATTTTTTNNNNNNNNNNNSSTVNPNNSSSSTSISNLTGSIHSCTASSGRRRSFTKRPRSSTTTSFNNRLEDSFTPLNSLITSFDPNSDNIPTLLPMSPNSPPKLKHTQSQLNCCSYAELISDESWSTRSPNGSFSGASGASSLAGPRRAQQQPPPIRSIQSAGGVPTLRSPKWRK